MNALFDFSDEIMVMMECPIDKNIRFTNLEPSTQNVSRRFWDKENKLWVTVIQDGQLHIDTSGEAIYTVLGSCIAVCIRDVKLNIGGMNHFVLPSRSEYLKPCLDNEAARYGEWSIEMLLNGLYTLGAKKQNFEVKVFGGANVAKSICLDIGIQNIAFVRYFFEKEGIRLHAEDTGGNSSRIVHYFPNTGKVLMEGGKRKSDQDIGVKESEYINKLCKKSIVGDIELF